jgi:FkbH-like protein
VLLTLCSRNNEADALKVLEDHPHSLIRPQHLAGWRINWGDKAANLEELAAELNLGLDAFVFVDDSPTECERIAQALPMVDVLAVGTEPASLLRLVIDYDAWPRLPPTTEDLGRTESYVAERARRTEAASAASLDDFLASLELALHVEVLGDDAPVEAVARVAQLTQRTNQFTTTTLRCTPAEVEAFCGDPGAVVLAGHVRDRFGDYGLTAAAIARRDGSTARVIALLMSCRVLGRGVEAAFLAAVHSEATSRLGVDAMVVDYAPSAKNAPIREFLDGSGLARHDEDGGATYVASAGSAPTAPSHVALSAG